MNRQFLFTLFKKMGYSPKWDGDTIRLGNVKFTDVVVMDFNREHIAVINNVPHSLGVNVLGSPDLFPALAWGTTGIITGVERLASLDTLSVLVRHPRISRDLEITYLDNKYAVAKTYYVRPPLSGDFFICDQLFGSRRLRPSRPLLIPANRSLIKFGGYCDPSFYESTDSSGSMDLFTIAKKYIELGEML